MFSGIILSTCVINIKPCGTEIVKKKTNSSEKMAELLLDFIRTF